MSSDKLGKFLREVSNWYWDDFCRAEKDNNYTSNEAMIFALVRSCAMQKLDAIKISINRLDGKLKTPVIIESPKIFYLFPNAENQKAPRGELDGDQIVKADVSENPKTDIDIIAPPAIIKPEEAPDLPSMSFRQTLTKMAELPRSLPEKIIQAASDTEQWVHGRAPQPDEIPMVKSVVAAHLLTLASNRNINALSEVFDQIDGKLAETIQIVGKDLYITSYLTVAPDNAVVNDEGILQAEATVSQNLWAQKLGGQIR